MCVVIDVFRLIEQEKMRTFRTMCDVEERHFSFRDEECILKNEAKKEQNEIKMMTDD